MQCENEECENEATTAYRWPWGSRGYVCDTHLAAVKMQGVNLGQEPQLMWMPDDDDDDDDDDDATTTTTIE